MINVEKIVRDAAVRRGISMEEAIEAYMSVMKDVRDMYGRDMEMSAAVLERAKVEHEANIAAYNRYIDAVEKLQEMQYNIVARGNEGE